jgi:glycosyltransferase involved in cell wall biosynthesis
MGRVPVRLVTERGNQRINPGRGYLFYLRLEDFLSQFADWIIPNSYSGKDYLIKRGHNPERIKVIYNGINSQRLQPDAAKAAMIRKNMALPENGTVIGISASLIPLKDHETFLKAAQIVHDAAPQARFAILGDGPLKSSLTELAGSLGISPYVTFFGNQVEVSDYLTAFDILCLSSAQPEGCSNAILEAMVLGKPVVATDTGGNKELVEHNQTGLLVPIKDPRAMADAIISLIMKPELAAQMGQRGKESVKTRFSLEVMVDNYETLYEDTLRRKNVRKNLN